MKIATSSAVSQSLGVSAGAVPNVAGASERALLNPVQLDRTGSLIVFAENGKKPQHPARINVMPWPFGPESNPQ